jgi:hypothetical protein
MERRVPGKAIAIAKSTRVAYTECFERNTVKTGFLSQGLYFGNSNIPRENKPANTGDVFVIEADGFVIIGETADTNVQRRPDAPSLNSKAREGFEITIPSKPSGDASFASRTASAIRRGGYSCSFIARGFFCLTVDAWTAADRSSIEP